MTTTTIAMTTTLPASVLGTSAPLVTSAASLGCVPAQGFPTAGLPTAGFPTAVSARLRATGLSRGSLATIEHDLAGLGLGDRTDVRTASVRSDAHDAQGLPPRVAPV